MDGLDDPREPAGVERQRVATSGASLRIAVVAAVMLVLLAAVKPWAAPAAPAATARTDPPAAHAAVSPPAAPAARAALGTPTAAASGSVGIFRYVADSLCLEPGTWLVVDDDTLLGSHVRSWTVAATVDRASGPSDPAIPTTTIVSGRISTLGFCAPVGADPRQSGWSGTLWRISGRPDTRPGVAATYAGRPGSAGSIAPPPAAASAANTTAWPSGRYVLEARLPGGRETWLGVEIDSPIQ